jgi:hypothetical protein
MELTSCGESVRSKHLGDNHPVESTSHDRSMGVEIIQVSTVCLGACLGGNQDREAATKATGSNAFHDYALAPWYARTTLRTIRGYGLPGPC